MPLPTSSEIWNADTFDALRRSLIPSFDLLYDSAVHAVAATVPQRARVLDLGAGTGLLAAAVLCRLPTAEVVLVDRSEAMLEQARRRFADDARVQMRVAELADPLPRGPFDAVVSGLAIHHMPHEGKRDLFRRVREVLSADGVFVNVEQLAAPDAMVEAMYDERHEEHVQASACPAEEWAAGRERMKLDICAGLDVQLDWLRGAGFARVDCLAKDWRFGTYAAWVAA